MYRSNKAQATLMVILFVMLGFIVMLVISKVIIDIRNVQVLNVLELELEIGDEGGKLVSLLSTGNESTERMEAISMMYFTKLEDEEKSLNSLLYPMLNRLVLLNSTGDRIKEIGYPIGSVKKRFEAEVPIPGGGQEKDETKRVVRLEVR